jgi:hypothetical protein
LDKLLGAAIEEVGLWVDVEARDGLSIDVDVVGLVILYILITPKQSNKSYKQFNIHLITESNTITQRDAKRIAFVNKLKTATPVVGSRSGGSAMPLKSRNSEASAATSGNGGNSKCP